MSKDLLDDIFNPKPEEIVIGDPNSYLFSCGNNKNTELSFKGYKYIEKPSGLSITKTYKIIQVSSGGSHTAFVTEYGYLYLFGSALHNKLGISNKGLKNISNPTLFPASKEQPVVQIACGEYHTLCLFENGEIWGWGGTLFKKLGTKSSLPSQLPGFNKVTIVKIGCGDFHSVALSESGILFAWGGGGKHFNKGQLGHGTLDDIKTPRPISFFQNQPVHDFACGGYHTLGLLTDGQVYAWGSGTFGELGTGGFSHKLTPAKVDIDERVNVTSIEAGGHHTFFLTNEGQLLSCGKSVYGQTGQKTTENISFPTLVENISNKFVIKVSCGWNHTIALVSPNDVYSTGINKYGQLGVSDLKIRHEFTLISSLGGKRVNNIFAGGHHSWFLIDYKNPDLSDYEIPSPPLETTGKYLKEKLQSQKKARSFIKSSPFKSNRSMEKKQKNIFKEDSDEFEEERPKTAIDDNKRTLGFNNEFRQFKTELTQEKDKNPFQIDLDEQSPDNEDKLIGDDKLSINSDSNQSLPDESDNKDDEEFNEISKKIQQRIRNSQRGLNPLSTEQYDLINKTPIKEIQNFNEKSPINLDEENQDQKLQDIVKDLKIPQKGATSNESEELDSENEYNNMKIQQFMQASSSHLVLFTPLKLNHKFILIDYKLENEEKVEQGIQAALERIKIEDPEVIKEEYSKYDKFYRKDENGMLKALVNKKAFDSSVETFVVMIIQKSSKFEEQFDGHIPESDYDDLENHDTSMGKMYNFLPEDIEQDIKWKVLSRSYEIFTSYLYSVSNYIKIYELRSEFYK